MSRAICTNCGLEYPWRNKKGNQLKEFPCPQCGGDGAAIKHVEFIETVIKRCPECGKAGLQYAKRLKVGDSPPLKDGHFDWGAMYCPRCEKWVTPVREEKKYSGDAIFT